MVDTTKQTKGAGTQLLSLKEGSTFNPDAPTYTESDWELYSQVEELQPGEITVAEEQEDYLDDAEGDWNSYQPGAKDAGTTTATLVWKPGDAVQQKINADIAADTKKWWLIKYPNGLGDITYGFISSAGKTVSRKDKIKRTIKIRNSGKPVLDDSLNVPVA